MIMPLINYIKNQKPLLVTSLDNKELFQFFFNFTILDPRPTHLHCINHLHTRTCLLSSLSIDSY